MSINKNSILFIIMIFLLILISLIKPEWESSDGFFSQIMGIQNNGFGFDLTLIHGLRYLIMFPFISFKLDANYLYLVLGMVVYIVPYYLFLKNNSNFTQKIIMSISMLLFLFIFSERTFVTMLGGFYLFLYFTEIQNKYLLIYGFIFSILSSGNVLVFILYLLFFSEYIFKRKKVLKIIMISTVLFLFSFSLIHKYEFFLNESGGLFSMIQRATLFVSYEYNQTGRLIFVVGFLFSLIFLSSILIFKMKLTKKNVRIILFLLISLITFLFEGITFYSYLPVFIYVLLKYFRLKEKVFYV